MYPANTEWVFDQDGFHCCTLTGLPSILSLDFLSFLLLLFFRPQPFTPLAQHRNRLDFWMHYTARGTINACSEDVPKACPLCQAVLWCVSSIEDKEKHLKRKQTSVFKNINCLSFNNNQTEMLTRKFAASGNTDAFRNEMKSWNYFFLHMCFGISRDFFLSKTLCLDTLLCPLDFHFSFS